MKRVQFFCAVILSFLLVSCNDFYSLHKADVPDGETVSARLVAQDPANPNYAEALQKAVLFFEFNRAGDLSRYAPLRTNWRGPSVPRDGADVGTDLSGGYFDAGDHVKFNLPMAYSMTSLAWSYYENRAMWDASGQKAILLNTIKVGTDYLMACLPDPAVNTYYFQVGQGGGGNDHGFGGAAEMVDYVFNEGRLKGLRSTYTLDATHHGASVLGQSAAALASASLAFRPGDPAYADKLVQYAKAMYGFAEATKSDVYYNSIAGAFYKTGNGQSGAFYDELSLAGVWLYLAGAGDVYLTKADGYVAQWLNLDSGDFAFQWTSCWEDSRYIAQIFLARLSGDPARKAFFKNRIETNLDYLLARPKIGGTADGAMFLDSWGNLRYASGAALIANVWAKSPLVSPAKTQAYKSFAKRQLDFTLGSNGRKSYVIGFGKDWPKHPHHRTATASWIGTFERLPLEPRHVLVGALLAGPNQSGVFDDDVSKYQMTEAAMDYNATLVAALSEMVTDYGGAFLPASEINGNEIPGEELVVKASVNYPRPNGIELRTWTVNKTAWPMRVNGNLSFRYYFDISEILQAGKSIADVRVSMNWSDGSIAVIKGPFAVEAGKPLYYVELDWGNTKIYPVHETDSRREAQFKIETINGAPWDNTNDWSYRDVLPSQTELTNAPSARSIPVYENGIQVFGDAPRPPNPLPVGAFSLSSPSAGTVDVAARPSFSWTAAANATAYRIVVSAKSDLSAPVIDQSGLTAPGFTASADLAPSSMYYWQVTATGPVDSRAAGNGPLFFSTKTVDRKVGAFSLSSPAPGTVDAAVRPSFLWTAAANATAYRIVVSAKSDLSAPVIDQSGLTAPGFTASADLALNTRYYWHVTATGPVDSRAAGNGPGSFTTRVGGETASLILTEYNRDRGVLVSTISPIIRIANTGSAPVDLNKVRIRYYLHKDGASGVNFWCDYSGGPVHGSWDEMTSFVRGTVAPVSPSKPKADTLVEISFIASAGILKAGGYIEIQTRITHGQWTQLDQSNDWSFNAVALAFAPAPAMTLWYDGVLLSGTAP